MKFTDGYWLKRPGFTVVHPRTIQEVRNVDGVLTAWTLSSPTLDRGAELDAVMLTVRVAAAAPDVLRVSLVHHAGTKPATPRFALDANAPEPHIRVDEGVGTIRAGRLTARIAQVEGSPRLEFLGDGRTLTASRERAQGVVADPQGVRYLHEQLTLEVGETVYGLGERFGPTTLNGQQIDVWNADGGTATHQAYKNVPFYLTSAGYGIFVNHPGRVSFEVGSEINARVQFSVAGESLEYYVIYGPTPAEVLEKYTALTGRAPQVPAWSYGLWLSTSFTTDYGEDTVESFLARMAELELPLSVLHFDCYWMRPSHWCDFTWDPDRFPDPPAMLRRYHDRGLKVCVWINPYIGQRSHLFAEGAERGFLLKRRDGGVQQWDHWQSGMAWVDFTNPDAVAWWQGHLRRLLRQGVDAFKTDFGERVPTDVVWHDGSDPERMHNYYTHLYNRAAYEVIAQERGKDEAIVFARSATSGGQQYPVHWGGDSEPTFASMGETLRGGLSLSLSGFGFWSHDIGGFEGTPDADVFTRWLPFGLLSSHSRLHGSRSYRVPWLYGEDAVACARRFIALKNRLMPYLRTHALEVTQRGLPLLRHLLLGFPDDPGSRHVDTQYLFGPSILVAPVFTASGDVDVYLPTDGWTDILSGRHHAQRGWVHEVHGTDSLPVLVPDGTLLPVGSNASCPDADMLADLTLYVASPSEGLTNEVVVDNGSERVTFSAHVVRDALTVACDRADITWSVVVIGRGATRGVGEPGFPELAPGTRVRADGDSVHIPLHPHDQSQPHRTKQEGNPS